MGRTFSLKFAQQRLAKHKYTDRHGASFGFAQRTATNEQKETAQIRGVCGGEHSE
jgi:hypothetical protein